MADNAIELKAVTKQFAGPGGETVSAVERMDLDIRNGEFFSFLGPSGCGKTTTLRMIAGFEEPSEGTVLLDGDDVTGLPPFRRPTNTIFQSYALFPQTSVGKKIAFGLQRQGISKDENRENSMVRTRASLPVVSSMPASPNPWKTPIVFSNLPVSSSMRAPSSGMRAPSAASLRHRS